MVSTRADFAKIRSIISNVQSSKDRIEHYMKAELSHLDTQLNSLLKHVTHVELMDQPVESVYTVFWSQLSEQHIVAIRSKHYLKACVFVAYIAEIESSMRIVRCETTTQRNFLNLYKSLRMIETPNNITRTVINFFTESVFDEFGVNNAHIHDAFAVSFKNNSAYYFDEPWRQWRYMVSRLDKRISN